MNSILVAKRNLSVSLHPATVIHADKYTDTRGGAFDLPVRTTLHNEVVFRSKQTHEDWPIHISGRNLPIYSNQDVIVIAVEEKIMGYVDSQTGKYYYTSTNFFGNFDLGISLYKIWLVGIITAIACFFLLPDGWKALCLVPLVITFGFYRIHKTIVNQSALKAMNDFLSSR